MSTFLPQNHIVPKVTAATTKNAFCFLILCFSLLLVCRHLAFPTNEECGYDKWISLLSTVYWLLLRQVVFTCWGKWPLAAQSLHLHCLCYTKGRGNLSQYPVTAHKDNSSCFRVGLMPTTYLSSLAREIGCQNWLAHIVCPP